MKPKNVHRGVSNMPTESTGAQAARVGKLSRIHRTYKSGNRRQRSRGKSRSHNRLREYLNYFIGTFVLILLAGVCWMIYTQITKKAVDKTTTTLTQDTFNVPHPSAAECAELARKALTTEPGSNWESLVFLRTIDHPTFAQGVEEIKKEHAQLEKTEWAGVLEINDLSLEMVVATFGDGTSKICYLTHDAKGVWRLDGESFLEKQSKSWDEIVGKGNCRAIVRVVIAPDAYYNGVFKEAEWTCLSLKTVDGEHQLSGYVRPQSQPYLAVAEIFKSSVPAPVIVEISRNSGMEPKQYEIKKVIAHGWVQSDVDFSSKFTAAPQK